MCKDCGCGLPGETPVRVGEDHEHVHGSGHEHPHVHPHSHGEAESGHEHTHSHEHSLHHDHDHDHDHPPHVHQAPQGHSGEPAAAEPRRTVEVRRAILEKNDRLAERNRGFFQGRGILVLNVLSSPGSGKTTLLCETGRLLSRRLKMAVIVGDLATDNDARRLRESGIPVVQITTGTVCHLEAEMVGKALKQLDLAGMDLLVVENVGNLVCPASYDLGEALRVVLLSVTEGEDKPLKYPPIFQSADVVIVSKTDLAEACGWDRERGLENIRRAAPGATIFELSARTGGGLSTWVDYLATRTEHLKTEGPLGA